MSLLHLSMYYAAQVGLLVERKLFSKVVKNFHNTSSFGYSYYVCKSKVCQLMCTADRLLLWTAIQVHFYFFFRLGYVSLVIGHLVTNCFVSTKKMKAYDTEN